MATDLASAATLFVALSIIRFGIGGWEAAWRRAGIDPIVVSATYALIWVSLLWLLGMYRARVRWSIRSELMDVLRAGVLLAIASFSALFVLKLPEFSRLFLISLFLAQAAATFALRLAIRLGFRLARARGMSARFILIVGTGDAAEAFSRRIERHRELGLRVLGHLSSAAGETTSALRGSRPILGSIDEIEDILHRHVVDEVGICLPPAEWSLVEPITRLCEEEGKIVRIPLFEGQLSLPGARHEEFDGIPILSLVYGPDRIVALLAKRVVDVATASAALVLLSPAFLVVGLWIAVRDGRPIFFRQPRVGLHGRVFRVLKFRTMVLDAEERLDQLMELNEIQGHAFKLSNDPRQTRTGRILRQTSIDELPQLWNVLRGQMSLVGPRPPLPREVEGYTLWHRRRLSMKPGITGLWQVSARREEEFDRWVEMDLDYIDRWSLWLDFQIIFRTIPAMLQGR